MPCHLTKQTYKINWIKSLLAIGLAPEIQVLEEAISKDDLCEMEREWIVEAKRLGCRLTNLTDGGEGTYGREKTQEEVEKIRASNIASKAMLTKEQETALCSLYLSGKTTYELAFDFAIERHTVSRMLKRNNVLVRKKPEASRRKIATNDLPFLRELYEKGYSSQELAKKFNTYSSNITANLRMAGTKIRSHSEAFFNFRNRGF
jgi:DNA-binding MarR family transcriptional regulator